MPHRGHLIEKNTKFANAIIQDKEKIPIKYLKNKGFFKKMFHTKVVGYKGLFTNLISLTLSGIIKVRTRFLKF